MKILRMMLKHPQLLELTGYEKHPDKDGQFLNSKTREEIFNLIKEARYFVIDSDLISNPAVDAVINDDLQLTFPLTLQLTLPFSVCWFEYHRKNKEEIPVSIGIKEENGSFFSQVGILVREISPGVFDMFCLELSQHKNTNKFGVNVSVFRNISVAVDPNSEGFSAMVSLKVWLRALNSGDLGVESTDTVIHVPRPDRLSKTKPHIINKIIRIVPKSKQKPLALTQGGVVDWSHRWEVRGHWRKVDGIGKDRDGDYLVNGFTWVKTHEKGPEEKELIKKTRVVVPATSSKQVEISTQPNV